MLPRKAKKFLSLNTVWKEYDHFLFPTEFSNKLHLSGLPPHGLVLKRDTIVILLTHLNAVSNLMSGTRFIVRTIYNHSLDLKSITGQEND
jgi:hypothetical protein